VLFRSGITTRMKSGSIVEPVKYQQFMSYKTDFETRGRSDIGVHRQGDAGDPWSTGKNPTWTQETNYPVHYTKQEPISRWRENQIDTSNVHQWKADLYGFQYILQKDAVYNESIYTKRGVSGHMEMRLLDGTVKTLFSVLTCLLDEIGSFEIYDFDLFYDVMLIRTHGKTILYKLDYDAATKTIVDDPDNLRPIGGFCVDDNTYSYKAAGAWFFPTKAKVVVANVRYSTNDLTLVIHTYNTTTGIVTHREMIIDPARCSGVLDTLDFDTIEAPMWSFNDKTDTFALTFLVDSAVYPPGFVVTVYVRVVSWEYEISEIRVVAPGKYTQSLT